MNKAIEGAQINRRTGNTTWILKAAVNAPDCIIVCKDQSYASELEFEYKELLLKSKWWLRLKWLLLGRKHPKFISVYMLQICVINKPLIFDNSALN